MSAVKQNDPNVTTLTGSSPSTGIPPEFRSITVSPRPQRPTFRSSSERLAELVAEHERLVDFYDAANEAEDTPEFKAQHNPEDAKGSDHADRMLRECQIMIQAIPARSIVDLGLKARTVTWSKSEWWEDKDVDGPHEVRNLIDDVLNLAGVDRMRSRDFPFASLLPGYAGPPRHLDAAKASEAAPASSPADLVEALAQRFAGAVRRDGLFDAAGCIAPDDQQKRRMNRGFNQAVAEIRSIENATSYHQASTASGALFQLILISGGVSALNDIADEPERALVKDSIMRMIYSVADVLERLSGTTAESLGGDYHLPAGHNPFVAGPSALEAEAEAIVANRAAA